jgi:tetratricopeptide (TPR) repeat protein
MPVTVKKDLFLAAVLGLEKARQFRSAINGYGIALKRWPESVPALTGIGNCYYALGELKKAESAFKEIIRLNPKAGSAYNNLAVVLFEQGRKQEAIKAVKKAVLLGGPLGSEYQKTLEEIKGSGIP